MATARPIAIPQDENDVAHGQRVKFDAPNGGFSFPAGKGLGGSRAAGGNAAKTPGKGLTAGRKALGNITNTAGKGLKDGGHGKTPGAGKAVRRVLGDVTNTTPGLQQRSAVAEPAAAPAAVPAPAQSRAELYAADGVERRSGKGWKQLEAERLRREAAAAEQRARDAILPWATRRLPSQDLSLQQLARRSAAAVQEREMVPPCPPSPTLPASPTRADDAMAGISAAASGNALVALLPEIDESLLLDDMNLND